MNQAFIKAFARAEAPRDFRHGPCVDEGAHAPAPSNGFRPHTNFAGPAGASRNESMRSGVQTQSAPRPHVQFPADIRIDAEDRRHTRIDGRLDYEISRDDCPAATSCERRPLSEFTGPDNHPALRAAYEVDQFAWPPLCEQLALASAVELDALANRIIRFAQSEGPVVSVIGNAPFVGCTTATLTLARRMALAGARVVLVDASFDRPALATRLGLASTQGWDDALLGEIALADAIIQSVADDIAIAPIRRPIKNQSAHPLRQGSVAGIISQFREVFDVVLLDAGAPPNGSDRERVIFEVLTEMGVNGAVVVTDSEASASPFESPLEIDLRARGVSYLGAIRNFVP